MDVDIERFYRLEVAPEQGMRMLGEGMQWQSLRPFRETFGDQLLIVFLDDVQTDPAGTYRQVLRHVGVDDSFVPPDVGVPRFQGRDLPEVAPPSLGARQFVYAWNRDDVGLLAAETGRDLGAWDPGIGPDTPSGEDLIEIMAQLIVSTQLAS